MNFVLMITSLLISISAFSMDESLKSVASLRIEHARELLGNFYEKSVVSNFEIHKELDDHISEIVKKRLPAAYKMQSEAIAQTILTEARKYGLDPYFVLAVISGESSFNPKARGPVGEIGMMQVRPTTGKWIAKIMKLRWRGQSSLHDPISNIKIGTAYLAWLREKFNNHSQLYLAAYNMGPRSVKNALSKNIWPKDYPIHVMKRYLAFYKQI